MTEIPAAEPASCLVAFSIEKRLRQVRRGQQQAAATVSTTQDPLHSLYETCDERGCQTSDNANRSQTMCKTADCASYALSHDCNQLRSSPRCTGCRTEATIILETITGKAQLDVAPQVADDVKMMNFRIHTAWPRTADYEG